MGDRIFEARATVSNGGNRALVWGVWALGLGLFANAVAALWGHAATRFPDVISGPAYGQGAQNERMMGAAGLFMSPAQLGPNVYGLYLMDIDSETLCVYRMDAEDNRFRLISTRQFRYDTKLADFNNQPPTPRDVQKLIDQQKEREKNEGTGERHP